MVRDGLKKSFSEGWQNIESSSFANMIHFITICKRKSLLPWNIPLKKYSLMTYLKGKVSSRRYKTTNANLTQSSKGYMKKVIVKVNYVDEWLGQVFPSSMRNWLTRRNQFFISKALTSSHIQILTFYFALCRTSESDEGIVFSCD